MTLMLPLNEVIAMFYILIFGCMYTTTIVAAQATLQFTYRDFTPGEMYCAEPNSTHWCNTFAQRAIRQYEGFVKTEYFSNNKIGHPDFESSHNYTSNATKNLVKSKLGAERKPVYNGGDFAASEMMSSKYDFQDWFRNSPRNNKFVRTLQVPQKENDEGIYYFDSKAFFPLNGIEGSWPKHYPESVNKYSFTAEHHSYFEYKEGQVFDFRGDDDVWIFINDELVVDLGGIHQPAAASVNLTKLDLVEGEIYTLDFFFAERHYKGSNFRLTTSIVQLCSVLSSAQSLMNTDKDGSISDNLYLADLNDLIRVVGGKTNETSSYSSFFGTPGYLRIPKRIGVTSGFSLSFTFETIHGNLTNQGVISARFSGAIDPAKIVSFDFLSGGDVIVSIGAESETRSKLSPRLQNLFDDNEHTITIQYLGKPNWIYIYVDDQYAPFMLIRDVNIEDAFGGNMANLDVIFQNNPFHPAWTEIKIKRMDVQVTAVDPAQSFYESDSISNKINKVPAGESVVVVLKSKDQCGGDITVGGLQDGFRGELVTIHSEARGRSLVEASSGVVDMGDGSYQFQFPVTLTGMYKVNIFYNDKEIEISNLDISVVAGPLDITNAVVVGDLQGGPVTGEMCPHSECQAFTIAVKDIFGNVPVGDDRESLIEISIFNDTSSEIHSANVDIQYNEVLGLFNVSYGISQEGFYQMTVRSADSPGNNVIIKTNLKIGDPIVEIDGKDNEIVAQDTSTVPLLLTILGVILVISSYAGYRLNRYRLKWRKEKSDLHRDPRLPVDSLKETVFTVNPALQFDMDVKVGAMGFIGDRQSLIDANKKTDTLQQVVDKLDKEINDKSKLVGSLESMIFDLKRQSQMNDVSEIMVSTPDVKPHRKKSEFPGAAFTVLG